jgi:hypothetical protein
MTLSLIRVNIELIYCCDSAHTFKFCKYGDKTICVHSICLGRRSSKKLRSKTQRHDETDTRSEQANKTF